MKLASGEREAGPSDEGHKRSEGPRWVRSFHDYVGESRELLGGKGYGLAEMTSLGLPIPEGFTITTEACLAYFRGDNQAPEELWGEVELALRALESRHGQRLGDPDSPLLVSVRSGAAVSMPGMMDTVLNLGINRGVAEGIARRSGNPAFAYDLYLRFIQMYSEVVMGVDSSHFSCVRDEWLGHAGVASTSQLDFESLEAIISEYQGIVFDATGGEVPEDPELQLRNAVLSVFDSWNSARAVDYRNHYGISHDMGTAVNVVAMVYGNIDAQSGTGVCFTRDPSTGERTLYGEYLANAQGEDLVSGASTPSDISELSRAMPEVYSQILDCAQLLEKRFSDAQDIEFTVESGKLYLLQTRAAQRSPRAAVRMAVEMADEGLISKEQALKRVNPDQVYNLLVPRLDESARGGGARGGTARRRRSGCVARRGYGPPDVQRRRGAAARQRGRAGGAGQARDQPGGRARDVGRRGHRHEPRRHDEPCGGRGSRPGQALRHRRRDPDGKPRARVHQERRRGCYRG